MAKRIRAVRRRKQISMIRGWTSCLLVLLMCLGSPVVWNCSHPQSSALDSKKAGHSIGFACALPSVRRKPDQEEKYKKKKKQSDDNDTRSLQQRDSADGKMSLNQILIKAGKRGLGGGVPGAIAGVVQVLTLMWLRTIINYQSRYGTSFFKAVGILYRDGGIGRFYRGVSFALFQAPISRFVSTAANDGVEALLASFELTKGWGAGRTTVVASIVVGFWRMVLMPVDTCKTVLQVDSVEGFRNLMRRVKAGKVGVLYQGAIANAISSIMGHYPWFFTYNKLSKNEWVQNWIPSILLRNAGIGLLASIVSDTVVNAVRVVKTTKQAVGSKHDLSYGDAIRMVLAADGWKGLFGRGLRTRIFANSLQSIVFTIIWRGLADRWGSRSSASSSSSEQSKQEGQSEEASHAATA